MTRAWIIQTRQEKPKPPERRLRQGKSVFEFDESCVGELEVNDGIIGQVQVGQGIVVPFAIPLDEDMLSIFPMLCGSFAPPAELPEGIVAQFDVLAIFKDFHDSWETVNGIRSEQDNRLSIALPVVDAENAF